MPIVSTPASPTPFVDDGEELMLVLRDFISASLSFQKDPQTAGQKDHYYLQNVERNADSALRLLKHMPVAKEAVFEYYSFVIDLLATQEFAKASSRNTAPLTNALEKLHKDLLELMRHPKLGMYWFLFQILFQEILRDVSFPKFNFCFGI